MSPIVIGCVICGYSVAGLEEPSRSWISTSRAVYADSGQVFLSGIGRRDLDGNYTAPINSRHRGDDSGYVVNREIPIVPSWRNREFGYLFHDACWDLLQQATTVSELNLERIFAICKSLPWPLRGIGPSWGHDYGSLFKLDTENHYPWEDMLMDPPETLQECVTADPVHVLGMPQLGSEEVFPYLSMARSEVDFMGLPMEILVAIGVLLPTKDAFSLSHCSKGLLPLLKSQAFWASRFRAGGEYDFFFERLNNGLPDWKSLYRFARHAVALPGLQNRKRIWGLIKDINDLLRLREVPPLSIHCDAGSAGKDVFRTVVNGDLRKPSAEGGEFFDEGCQIFRTQRAILHQDLSSLAISLVKVGSFEYVTGLRLVYGNRAENCLGYINDRHELHLKIDQVKGIVVAMGSRGVRALQVINGEGRKSRWFGCPNDCPVTRRLVGSQLLEELEVGIDGYKLVSLSATGLGLESQSSFLKPRQSSLRCTALWYPTVPPPDLDLNDQSFTGNCASADVYRPLCWIRFGRPSRTSLRSLTGISVTRLGELCEIEVHYDTDDVPRKFRRLGRRPYTAFSETFFFAIDGPGGEFITSIEVGIKRRDGRHVYDFYKHGKLDSLRVITNRGRAYHFQSTESPQTTYSLAVTPGTTITGLYASQHPELGFVSLGLISEVLNDPITHQSTESTATT